MAQCYRWYIPDTPSRTPISIMAFLVLSRGELAPDLDATSACLRPTEKPSLREGSAATGTSSSMASCLRGKETLISQMMMPWMMYENTPCERDLATEMGKRPLMRVHRRPETPGSDRSEGPIQCGETDSSRQRAISHELRYTRG